MSPWFPAGKICSRRNFLLLSGPNSGGLHGWFTISMCAFLPFALSRFLAKISLGDNYQDVGNADMAESPTCRKTRRAPIDGPIDGPAVQRIELRKNSLELCSKLKSGRRQHEKWQATSWVRDRMHQSDVAMVHTASALLECCPLRHCQQDSTQLRSSCCL